MADRRIGVIINGATGGIATRQHLDKAIVPIINEGGLRTESGTIIPDPVLVGRNEQKLRDTARRFGLCKWTTDLDGVLADPAYEIFFDAGPTGQRPRLLRAALEAGKHIYSEKPVVTDLDEGQDIVALANSSAGGMVLCRIRCRYPG